MQINETIELTKKEMHLRNEADKIGSNIEDYLTSLDVLLEQKASSIQVLRGKIAQIKGYLRESKRIEEQYAHLEKQLYQTELHQHELYQQQEESLLEDDEVLFV